MIAILTAVRGNLNEFFICISFMARDIEYLFMYLLFLHIHHYVNYRFNSIAPLLIVLFVYFGV
jgi:hypothetical protein